MQYKTISMELLRQHAKLHDQLRREQRLLEIINALATVFKSRHGHWQKKLSQTQPALDEVQRASAASELAMQEIEARLQLAFPPNRRDGYSVNTGMAYLRSLMSPD